MKGKGILSVFDICLIIGIGVMNVLYSVFSGTVDVIGSVMGPFPYSQIPGKCASGNSAYRSSGEYERIILIPYGCTDLRISEFPVINN